MTLPILLLALFLVPVLGGIALAWRDPFRIRDTLTTSGWPSRLNRARMDLTAVLGDTWTALAILLAGWGGIVLVCWPLGIIAKGLQGPIDVPLFEWMQARLVATDPWTRLTAALTPLGDLSQTGAVTLAAAIVFAVMWRHRRWWMPPLVLGVTLGSEVAFQKVLGLVVDRGHPPTALGTWPSGGSARVIAVFGVIWFLALVTWPTIPRPWRAIGWTTVGLLAALEGYTRFYLLQHWATDVLGGWVFGALLLLVIIASASTLLGPNPAHDHRGSPETLFTQ